MPSFRERRESDSPRGPFPAPLIAAGIAVLAVAGVLLFNALRPPAQLTVESLTPPAVAAEHGGYDVFPPHSLEAFVEDAKFGYLPAPALMSLADGTVVVADEEDFAAFPGTPGPVAELTPEEFAGIEIPSPRPGPPPGQTTTWDGLLDELGGATVYVARIDDAEVLAAALDAVAERELEDSVIVRTEDAGVLQAAAERGVAVMAAGTLPDSLLEGGGLEGVHALIPADAGAEQIGHYTGAGAQVWISEPETEAALAEAAEHGAFGAVAGNPFTVLPQETR
ncbi:hypothetical protein [Sediminivirga luteola]|uniref:Uncharacterized protein n=1 Tax=Sediminivirga luteola TaxID=1774748 RepID=A0A8J2TXL2_9MICO|nr:hypothetical protein [Sediminivirga luteola]MCI2266683.1 hypothetical protein [Sediminivirga luteola]GGA13122.1 hypothetical protein GCM10011333_15060 [Sediminivirga luteola]